MSDTDDRAIDGSDPYDHQRAFGYMQNVTLAELTTLDDAELVRRHDALMVGRLNIALMEAEHYRAEFYRRETVRAREASERAEAAAEQENRRLNQLLALLAALALMPLVLDLWDRWHWGQHLDRWGAAFCAANGC